MGWENVTSALEEPCYWQKTFMWGLKIWFKRVVLNNWKYRHLYFLCSSLIPEKANKAKDNICVGSVRKHISAKVQLKFYETQKKTFLHKLHHLSMTWAACYKTFWESCINCVNGWVLTSPRTWSRSNLSQLFLIRGNKKIWPETNHERYNNKTKSDW